MAEAGDGLTHDAACRVWKSKNSQALSEPERLLAWAQTNRSAFRPVDFNQYPGQYVMAPPRLQEAITDFFMQRMRPLFDARRLIQQHARVSMVTLPPEALRPPQWLCHSDHFGLDPTQSIQASVLYLFKDTSLGGTGFYSPTGSNQEMNALFDDTARMSADAFAAKYQLAPGYIRGSNRYFDRIGGVEARWNRMVFYDGTFLHSGDISAPRRLSEDPSRGRLTLNGFFTCRRHAQ